jgi:hypothetical protein
MRCQAREACIVADNTGLKKGSCDVMALECMDTIDTHLDDLSHRAQLSGLQQKHHRLGDHRKKNSVNVYKMWSC